MGAQHTRLQPFKGGLGRPAAVRKYSGLASKGLTEDSVELQFALQSREADRLQKAVTGAVLVVTAGLLEEKATHRLTLLYSDPPLSHRMPPRGESGKTQLGEETPAAGCGKLSCITGAAKGHRP